jgi:hypothetical protein
MAKWLRRQATCGGNTYHVFPSRNPFQRACWRVVVAEGNRTDPGLDLGTSRTLEGAERAIKQHAGDHTVRMVKLAF